MHEAALAQAALPHPVYVLGLKMRPYSIGHELWLIRRGNLLLSGGFTKRDVYDAAIACSESWGGIQKLSCDKLLFLKTTLWRWKTRKADFSLEAKAFLEYRAAGSMFFEVDDSLSSGFEYGRQPGAPFILRLASLLVTKHSETWSTVFDFPLGLAQMIYQSHLENDGAMKVWNSANEAFRKYIEEEEAKEAACRH